MKKSGILVWLWRGCAGKKRKIALMTLVQMGLSLIAVGNTWLLGGIVDSAVAGEHGRFWAYGLGFVVFCLGLLALRALYRRLIEDCRATLENVFKGRLFQVLLDREYARVTAVHSGEWMNRLTSDTVVVADGLTSIIPEVTGMAVKLVGALALLMYYIPKLGLVILPAGGVMLVLTLVFRRRLKKLHKAIQERDGSLRSFLTERLGAMLVLRSFGQEQAVVQEGSQLMEDHKVARMRRSDFSNLCNLGFGAAMQGAYVLGALVCGYGILTGTMGYGTFTSVLQLIMQIQAPFANISGFLPRFYAAIASAERLQEAEAFPGDYEAQPLDGQEIRALYGQLRAIRFKDAAFSYPGGDGLQVFQDLQLSAKKGEYVAFTGHSGCGKSTALKLLLSLYPLEAGERLLETGAGELPLTAQHRGLFAYVPQGNQLLSGTVRQIVAFANQEAMEDEARLKAALQVACAWDFVCDLERGLDTPLAERGAGLSEGQLQRLAIARAVFSGRPILLLDEATSALDEETEARVLENLRAMTDKTVFIVTHRPAALEICDKQISFGA